MLKAFLTNLAETLAEVSLLRFGSEPLFWRFWNWHRELTRPARERRVREFLARALKNGSDKGDLSPLS